MRRITNSPASSATTELPDLDTDFPSLLCANTFTQGDQVEFRLSPLKSVAGLTKVMDDSFIAESGTDITAAFTDYLRPLLGSDLPTLAGFGSERVAKILNK